MVGLQMDLKDGCKGFSGWLKGRSTRASERLQTTLIVSDWVERRGELKVWIAKVLEPPESFYRLGLMSVDSNWGCVG